MYTEIHLVIDNNKLYIREQSCLPKEYEISNDIPSMIHEICEHLGDYLEGLY